MSEICGAKTRRGTPCQRQAGWGTESTFGRCAWHGGASPNGRVHAARQEGRAAAARLGIALETDPGEALLACVHLDAGEVAFLQERAQLIEEGEEFRKGDLHPTLRAFQAARDRLARHSKLALDAGIDERRVRLVESLGQQLGPILRDAIEEVDLSAAQRHQLREALARHLSTLELVEQKPPEIAA